MVLCFQRMTDLEFTRRATTGTLLSSTVAAQTIRMLSNDPLTAIKKAKVRLYFNVDLTSLSHMYTINLQQMALKKVLAKM